MNTKGIKWNSTVLSKYANTRRYLTESRGSQPGDVRRELPTRWKRCCRKWRFGLNAWTPESNQQHPTKNTTVYPLTGFQSLNEMNAFRFIFGVCTFLYFSSGTETCLLGATLRQVGSTKLQRAKSHPHTSADRLDSTSDWLAVAWRYGNGMAIG